MKHEMSGLTNYSLNVSPSVCVDVVEMMSKHDFEKNLWLGAVGDVILSAHVGSDGEAVFKLTTGHRHRLCSLHVYDKNLLFKNFMPGITSTGLHKLGLRLQGILFCFDSYTLGAMSRVNDETEDRNLTALRSRNLYVLNPRDKKLNCFRVNASAGGQRKTQTSQPAAKSTKFASGLRLGVVMATDDTYFTASDDSLFREFYKMNSKMISRVMQSLKTSPDVLMQARALCVNAALLACSTNLNDDTWSATMQTITVDGDFRDKFAKEHNRVVGRLMVPCSEGIRRFAVVCATEMADLESCHAQSVLAVCVKNRYVFIGSRNTVPLGSVHESMWRDGGKYLNASAGGTIFQNYCDTIRQIITASAHYDFIETQKDELLSQVARDIKKSSTTMNCQENAILRVMVNCKNSLTHALYHVHCKQ